MDLTAERRLAEHQTLAIAIAKFSDDEPNDAYQAFLCYVSLSGPARDTETTAIWSGYTKVQCKEWSEIYNWAARADAVDAQRWLYEEQQRQEFCKSDNIEFADKNREIKKQGQDILSKMLGVASKLLDHALEADEIKEIGHATTDDGRRVAIQTITKMTAKVSDIPRLVSTSITMSRLLNDLPTEIVDNRNIIPSNLQSLSWEELQRLEEDNRDVFSKLSGAQKLGDTPQ